MVWRSAWLSSNRWFDLPSIEERSRTSSARRLVMSMHSLWSARLASHDHSSESPDKQRSAENSFDWIRTLQNGYHHNTISVFLLIGGTEGFSRTFDFSRRRVTLKMIERSSSAIAAEYSRLSSSASRCCPFSIGRQNNRLKVVRSPRSLCWQSQSIMLHISRRLFCRGVPVSMIRCWDSRCCID